MNFLSRTVTVSLLGSLHLGRHSTGEQHFHRHRTQRANPLPGLLSGAAVTFNRQTPARTARQHAQRQPHRGVDQRNLDWAKWAKRSAAPQPMAEGIRKRH